MNQVIELIIAVCTIAMEAGNQPRIGKLAVAFTIANRAKRDKLSWTDICLKSSQFSCWNTNSPTRMNLDTHDDALWAECLRAALAAMFSLEPDPTDGAYFYLNKATVMAITGKLPDWWEIDGDPGSEKTFGDHSFRRHR